VLYVVKTVGSEQDFFLIKKKRDLYGGLPTFKQLSVSNFCGSTWVELLSQIDVMSVHQSSAIIQKLRYKKCKKLGNTISHLFHI
jgi:hypothetical protein